MSITIREYKEADDEPLKLLEENSPAGVHLSIATVYEEYNRRFRAHAKSKSFVAEKDGQIVGVVCGSVQLETWQHSTSNSVMTGYVFGLRVSADVRRKGVALLLTNTVIEWMKSEGAVLLYAMIKCDNTPSLSLFLNKLGFAPCHTHLSAGIIVPSASDTKISDDQLILSHLQGQDMIEALKQKFSKDYNLFPLQVEHLINHPCNAGMFIIQTKDGSSSATCCVWKTYKIHTFKIVAAPLLLRAFLKTYNFIAKWTNKALLPQVGESMRFWSLFGISATGPEGLSLLQRLISHINNLSQEEGVCACMSLIAPDLQRDIWSALPVWHLLSEKFLWAFRADDPSILPLTPQQSNAALGYCPTQQFFVDPRHQ